MPGFFVAGRHRGGLVRLGTVGPSPAITGLLSNLQPFPCRDPPYIMAVEPAGSASAMSKSLAYAALGMWATLAVLDFLWLSTMTKAFYRPRLGALLNEQPVWAPALLFYFLYGAGLLVFVLRPALIDGSGMLAVLLWGCLFGLVAYGTYDLTNHATIRDWPLAVTVVDMAWGALISGVASVIGVWVARKFA